ncbi:hypothetical protein [Noviherbaspirillum sp. ST9]|uniref:hypothetical protein n=1 Tax=Noviherbaspirillum sp. ST9 TaxID=3401606 RepID=UPI003B589902
MQHGKAITRRSGFFMALVQLIVAQALKPESRLPDRYEPMVDSLLVREQRAAKTTLAVLIDTRT